MKQFFPSTLFIVLALVTFSLCTAAPSDEYRVLPETIDGTALGDMMKQYLLSEVETARLKWVKTFEALKTTEQIQKYQKQRQAQFIDALGGFPQRIPLKPQVTGVIRRKGYRVEKVIFESQPKHYVTALMFVPESNKFKMPYPGVLVPCGHSSTGKGSQAYQTMGASLALHGMAALVFDPIDQGERAQLLDENQKPPIWGTTAHTMIGVASILLGRNTARFEIWDGMRAIDYLQLHPAVDPGRIGCTGNSGGGTQTSYLMTLDDRIGPAAPSCYITSFWRLLPTIGPQDAEQNIYGQLSFGLDHADYLIIRAPKPTLICAATKDFFDIDGVWDSFRYAKRVYTRLNFPERVSLLENDASHNYNQLQREGVLRWMSRWLLNQDQPLTEPKINILSAEELQCTPHGRTMLLKGARSVYDLNIDYEKELAQQRQQLWKNKPKEKLREQVRKVTGIRRWQDLPKPKVEKVANLKRKGYHIEKLILQPKKGIYLPALQFVPNNPPTGVVLYVNEKGKQLQAQPGGDLENLVKQGKLVLAVDLRGMGETQQTGQRKFDLLFGSDWKDTFTAYLLGRSYVQMRAEDILICAGYLTDQLPARVSKKLELIAVGNVGVPALHAAALEPHKFQKIKISETLISWSDVIHRRLTKNQLVNTVHGALKTYDLPDLAVLLGDKLTIENPLDANGNPAKQ